MNKLIVITLLVLSTQFAYAQKYFKVSKDQNSRDFNQCQANHGVVFKEYLKVINSQMNRLVRGIDYEISREAPKLQIEAYKKQLIDIIIKRIVIQEMQKQLSSIKLATLMKDYPPKKLVFNTDHLYLNIDEEFQKILNEAFERTFLHAMGEYSLKRFQREILISVASTFATNAYKTVGKGLVAKIVAGTLGKEIAKGLTQKALMSFGSQVLKGTLRGGILAIITQPLYGGRKPPETLWVELLEKNPEFILNPEWMKLAKHPDEPWWTHCISLVRRTSSLERALTKFLKSEEADFMNRVRQISKMKPLEEPDFEDYPYVVARDNTYVHRALPLEALTPFWALEKL